jgi:hypothetical protein
MQFGQRGVAPHQYAPADLRTDDAQPVNLELIAGHQAASADGGSNRCGPGVYQQ